MIPKVDVPTGHVDMGGLLGISEFMGDPFGGLFAQLQHFSQGFVDGGCTQANSSGKFLHRDSGQPSVHTQCLDLCLGEFGLSASQLSWVDSVHSCVEMSCPMIHGGSGEACGGQNFASNASR